MLHSFLSHSGSAPPESSAMAQAGPAADWHTPEPPATRRGDSSPPHLRVRRSSRIAALHSLREGGSPDASAPVPHRNVSRPSIVLTDLFSKHADLVLPSIEADASNHAPAMQILSEGNVAAAGGNLLTPFQVASYNRLQTPEPMNGISTAYTPSSHQAYGESILRASSAFSASSSSSDESNVESADQFSVSGSTTSPETEASTPYGSMYKRMRPAAALDYGAAEAEPKKRHRRRPSKAHFTKAMDQHLWATFIKYLENPQMAPFAMRPGQSPPGGVQHLVARQARRSWRGGDSRPAAGPVIARKRSSDTLVPRHSSHDMQPEYGVVGKAWPSKTATRARLRELCREQGQVTPHMQQRLKSRSPTPLASRSRAVPRPSSHNIRFNSLSELSGPSAYNTRDVRISLAASTSSTMRRNGPLAQLATRSDEYFEGLGEWFGDASSSSAANPAATPPSARTTFGGQLRPSITTAAAPRLGSPFGNHTWGPGEGRQIANELQQHGEAFHASVPRLRSPFQLGGVRAEARLGSNKRRAPSAAEDEPAPDGSTTGGSLSAAASGPALEDPFGPAIGTQRRVRLRGATLGDIFAPRQPAGASQTFHGLPSNLSHTLPSHSSLFAPPALASPFEGIGARPTRVRTRDIRSESLQVFADPQAPSAPSIDSRLDQPDCTMADSS